MGAGRLEYLELEASGMSMHSRFAEGDEPPMLTALRLQIAVRLTPHLSLFAGAGVTTAVAWQDRDLDIGPGLLEREIRDGGVTVRIYPGFVLGLTL